MNDQNDQNGSRSASPPPPYAFCQNCGRPLDKEGARVVGSAVFCEPCLAARLGTAGAATPGAATPGVGAAAHASSDGVPPPGAGAGSFGAGPGAWTSPLWPPGGPAPTTPNPGLATLLGFIPGVGAMYNEQYAKGIVHLIVFAVLVTLVNANGIFLVFVFGWVFYMAIEAHHTAVARRDGTPLPNPFGLNDIGERFGFGKAWAAGPSQTYTSGPGAGGSYASGASFAGTGAAAAGTAGPVAAGSGVAGPGAAGPGAAGWGGESAVPPAPEGWGAPVDAYGASAAGAAQSAYDPAAIHDQAYRSAYGWSAPPPDSQPPYGAAAMPAYGTGPYVPPPYNATYVPPIAVDPAYVAPPSRFPAGAVWLIGLGTLFLLTTTGIFNGIAGGILVGFLLIGLGIWVFLRRMFETRIGLTGLGAAEYPVRVVRAARGAVWIVLLGLLLLLNDFHVLSWYRSWPLFIILAGVMALLDRAAWSQVQTQIPTQVPPAYAPPAQPVAPTGATRSAAASGNSLSILPARDGSEAGDLHGRVAGDNDRDGGPNDQKGGS